MASKCGRHAAPDRSWLNFERTQNVECGEISEGQGARPCVELQGRGEDSAPRKEKMRGLSGPLGCIPRVVVSGSVLAAHATGACLLGRHLADVPACGFRVVRVPGKAPDVWQLWRGELHRVCDPVRIRPTAGVAVATENGAHAVMEMQRIVPSRWRVQRIF